MNIISLKKISLNLIGIVACGVLLLPSLSVKAAPYGIADEPLFLVTNVAPNLILTLDDSGSMAWAYAPDSMSADRNTKRFSSPDYNPLYYNPNVTYPAPVDENGQELTTSFRKAWVNGFGTNFGYRDLKVNYRTTFNFYQSATNNSSHSYSDPAGATNLAYYFVYDTTLAGCAPSPTDDDCYRLVNVSAAEEQNFANWYSFYRYRNLATTSAASLAFAQLSGEVRVAWQALGAHDYCRAFDTHCYGWDSVSYDNRIRKFQGNHRDNFYNWLFRLPTDGSTPLRWAAQRAGEYFRTDRPYESDPGVTTNPVLACRQNYQILMTDGIWNSTGASGTAAGNTDGTARTLPDNTAYPGSDAPFTDGTASTLSDITFHYWATDLRPTLADSDTLTYTPVTVNETYTSASATKTLTPYWNPKNDPANWQHMVTFTIGLGLTNWLDDDPIQWQGDTYGSNGNKGYVSLASGEASWPVPASSSGNNVYDLWHAALNSRGQFFSADTPDDMVTAFQTIIHRIEDRQGSASNLSFNAGSVSSNTLFFQSLFESGDWSGHLLALPIALGDINRNGTIESSEQIFTCTTETTGEVCPTVWDAACNLTGGLCKDPKDASRTIAANVTPQPWDTGTNSRVILTYSDDGSGTKSGVAFRWANLDATQQATLQNGGSTVIGQATLDYIRGQRDCEEGNAGTCTHDIDGDGTADDNDKLARERNSLLGDIVNSSPVFVGPPERDYPDTFNDVLHNDPGESGYNTFASAGGEGTRTNVVYVGANDGMVHGFRSGSFSDSNSNGVIDVEDNFNTATNDGKEVLAYLPSKIYENLPKLTDPNYQSTGLHKFFADGEMEAVDAHFSGSWHSVLAGALGAGGQGIFTLDVTDPSYFSEASANAANTVLWEFTDDDDADLGNTFGQPVVIRLHNDRWGVAVGNGYNNTATDSNVSATGNAVLFILDVETGAVLAKLDTGVGFAQDPSGSSHPNGIGSITPIDLDSDVVTDFVYAADLFGNVWRFDLTSDNPNNWIVSYGAAPLFTATDTSSPTAKRQPITTKLLADKHPNGLGHGVMVYFGTGKYFEDSDNMGDTTTDHAFYGVWDSEFSTYNTLAAAQSLPQVGTSGSPAATANIVKSNLLEQKITYEGHFGSNGQRTLTGYDVPWNSKVGWYVNLLRGNGTLNDQGTTDTSDDTITAATSWTREGEMVVADPVIVGDSIVVSTLIPSDDACSTGGSGWVMVFNKETGGKLTYAPFHMIAGNEPVMGYYFGDAPPGTPAFISKSLYIPLGQGEVVRLSFRAGAEGRRTWTELQ